MCLRPVVKILAQSNNYKTGNPLLPRWCRPKKI